MQIEATEAYPDSIGELSGVGSLDTLVLPRHRWYYIKESFSPSLVNHAINDSKCQENDIVMDVFCGSGTVPLAATVEGYHAIGLEVNPFLAFVSRAKLAQCNPATLDRYVGKAITGIMQEASSALETFSTFSESPGADQWLFNRDVLRAFEGGWRATTTMRKPARDLLRLCLIAAAIDVCNAVKDGKCLRYRSNWKQQGFTKMDFLLGFESHIANIRQDLRECPLLAPKAEILTYDSRKITDELLGGRKFKLCVMSPPYLNSFDYTDIYRPELFLGKFVNSNRALQALRLNTMRSHVQVSWPDPEYAHLGQLLATSCAEIRDHADDLWNNRIPAMIQAYFEDMKKVLVNLKQIAQRDASVWIVVSTSAYAGVEIPVDLIIADIGLQAGWLLREIRVMHYLRRMPGQQWDKLCEKKNDMPRLRESIIILDSLSRTKAK